MKALLVRFALWLVHRCGVILVARPKAEYIASAHEFAAHVELQAEPWASESLKNIPVEWQNKKMNPEIFNEIIDYAERSGFPKAYFWGAEWWYWMKEKHGKPEMWDNAKALFNTNQQI